MADGKLMKYLTLLLLTILMACTPVLPPTAPPTVSMTATVIPPTTEPPFKLLHPQAIAVGSINVLQAVCYSRHTVWALYSWGMVQYEDEAAKQACIAAGVVF